MSKKLFELSAGLAFRYPQTVCASILAPERIQISISTLQRFAHVSLLLFAAQKVEQKGPLPKGVWLFPLNFGMLPKHCLKVGWLLDSPLLFASFSSLNIKWFLTASFSLSSCWYCTGKKGAQPHKFYPSKPIRPLRRLIWQPLAIVSFTHCVTIASGVPINLTNF